MDKEPKTIDLNHDEWKSETPKPHVPFFGDGLWPAVAYFASFAIVAWAVRQFL
jgi:hypothetical protein